MKTAVVILNWNGRRLLEEYLPSVVQNSADAEIVVADNGSTDDSLLWLRIHHPAIRTICLDRNYGFAGGYNRALREVDADYVVLLNSDIRPEEGWLQPLVEVLDQNSDVAVVAPKLRSIDNPSHFEYAGAAGGFIDYLGYPFCRGRILSTTEEDCGQYDDRRDVFWASGAAMCCRRELFLAMGGFDEDLFAHMEEIDLQWRMQLAAWRIVVEPRSTVYHLGGGTLPASPNKIFLNHRNNLAMLFKCSSPGQRVVVAIVRPFTDMAEAVAHLLMLRPQNAWAILRAWWAFVAWHRSLGQKRRSVVRKEGVELRGIYRGSIVLRWLCGKKIFNKMM